MTINQVGFTELVVTITGEVNTAGMAHVMDDYGREFEVLALLPKGTGQPVVGEQWLITKKLGRWTLDSMLIPRDGTSLPVISANLGEEPTDALQQVIEALAKHGLVLDQTTGKTELDPLLDEDTDPAVYSEAEDGEYLDEYIQPGTEIEPLYTAQVPDETQTTRVQKEPKNQKDRARKRERPVVEVPKRGKPLSVAFMTANLGRGVSTAEFTNNARRVHDKFPAIPRFIGWQEIDEGDTPIEHPIIHDMFEGEGGWVAWDHHDPIFVPKPWKIKQDIETLGAEAGGNNTGPTRWISQAVVYNPERPDIPTFVMMNVHFHRYHVPVLTPLWWAMLERMKVRARLWYGKGYSIIWTGDVNKQLMPKLMAKERVIFGRGIDQISVIEHPKGAQFRVLEQGTVDMTIDGHDADWVKMSISGPRGYVPPPSKGGGKPKNRGNEEREVHRKPNKDPKDTFSWLSVATYNQIAIIGPQRVERDLVALEKSGIDVLALQEAGWVARGETYEHNRPDAFEMYRPPLVPENTIMWRSETCELVDSGEHILVAGSGPESEMPPRGAAWVRLKHIDSQRVFTVLGTHLDPAAAFQGYFSAEPGRIAEHVARYKVSMAALKPIIEAHKKRGPVILAGCFNADYRRDSRLRNANLPFRTFKDLGLKSSYQVLGEPDLGTRDSDALLDAVYSYAKEKTLLAPAQQRILTGYASDNRPVVVAFKVKDKARATRRRQDEPDKPKQREEEESVTKTATLVTANTDFNRGGDDQYKKHLIGLTGKGVLFTQEVGHGQQSTKLRGVKMTIDHRPRIEIGEVGAHRGVASGTIKVGKKSVVLFCIHALHVDTSGQAAQDAYYDELAEITDRLNKRDVEWVVGGDFNKAVGAVASQLGGTAHGDGVDGFVVSSGLKVNKEGKNTRGLDRGWTDHPAYRITIEAKPDPAPGTPATATDGG